MSPSSFHPLVLSLPTPIKTHHVAIFNSYQMASPLSLSSPSPYSFLSFFAQNPPPPSSVHSQATERQKNHLNSPLQIHHTPQHSLSPKPAMSIHPSPLLLLHFIFQILQNSESDILTFHFPSKVLKFLNLNLNLNP